MSELRGEGVAKSTPIFIPAATSIATPRTRVHSPLATPSDLARGQAFRREPDFPGSAADLLTAAIALADEIAARPNHGETALPRQDLKRLADLGLLLAPLPTTHGGLGLGTDPSGHLTLLRLLAAIGGADLVLGRLYEGHVNALILITAYGSRSQLARAAGDCRDGRWFGVWNTGPEDLLRLTPGSDPGTFLMKGGKTFASGADFIQRPIVTAQREGGGWQMTMPRMESPEVANHVKVDRTFWNPLGMNASESYGIDFTGACLALDDLLGAPEDFYQEPLFSGGAIRFAAVQAGAILRLHRLFAEWLGRPGRAEDPYQLTRLGEVSLGAQEAVLWIERAAGVAADCLFPAAGKLAAERMNDTPGMVRLAIERIATAMMPRIIAGVGARGLLQPSPFERIFRDLTMYLRQPAPDRCLANLGRASLRRSALHRNGQSEAFWTES